MLARKIEDEWEFDPRTVCLQQRVEDLEHELREARGLDDEGVVIEGPWGTNFTIKQRQMIMILARSGGQVMRYLSVGNAMYPIERQPRDPANNVQVFLTRARLLLDEIGLRIDTRWGQGLVMPADDASRWIRWCEATDRGDPPARDYPLKVSFSNGRWVRNDG